MLKAAVIGVGSMGKNHVRVYRQMNDVELVGVADNNQDVADKIAAEFSTTSFANYTEMLEKAKPDVVSLVVPTELHYPIASEIIKRGVNVLVEKPVATTIEEAQSLIDLAKKHKVVFQVGHIERFNPAISELRRRMDMIGEIYNIHAQRLSPYPARIRDCGVVLDLASHDIDLFRFIINKPVMRLYGETHQAINSDREDMFNGLLRFDNGTVGVLDVNWVTPKKVRHLTVTGTRGMFTCDLLSQELYFYENGREPGLWNELNVLHGVSEGNILGIYIQRQEPLFRELSNFVEAAKGETDPLVTGEDGLETLRLANLFIESSESVRVLQELAPATA